MLDADLGELSERADRLARWVETETPTLDEIERRLLEAVDDDPDIFGIGVGFRRYAYDPDTRLASRYLVRRNGGDHQMVAVEDFYDYTAPIPEAEWMRRGFEQPGWQEPTFGEVSRALVVMYCVPFDGTEVDESAGGVCVNYSIDDVWELIAGLGLGETGYPMVLTDQGQFVAHPRREYVFDERGLRRIAAETDDEGLLRFFERAEVEESGFVPYADPVTGERGQIYFTRVAETQWTIAAIIYDVEIPRDWLAYRHRQMVLIAVGLVSLLFAVVAVVALRRFNRRALWGGSIAVSALFLVAIGWVWGLTSTELERPPPESIPLVSPGETTREAGEYVRDIEEMYHVTPRVVPTGLSINSLEVLGPTQFQVSGVVWCRYAVPEHDDLRRQVHFPDAVDGEVHFQQIMRYRQGDAEVVGWSFQAEIHQSADITWFPLDVRYLALRIWHGELDQHVVLVPDLERYSPVHPRSLPGTRQDLRMSGWRLHRTFFAFRFYDYGVDVGPPDVSSRGEFPELVYHGVIQRQLVEALLSHQMPLLIALVLMFAVAMLETRWREKADVFGFEAVKVLGVITAIFFALVVSHIEVRRRFVADELMYIDYFYFVTYMMIAVGAANGYMVNSPDIRLWFVDYEDNLLPKVLFWPVALAALFGVTVWVFA